MLRQVQLLYFAALRDLVGASQERCTLPADVVTVSDLAGYLEHRHPALQGRLGQVRFAIDEAFVDAEAPLPEASTVALIPPVCGG